MRLESLMENQAKKWQFKSKKTPLIQCLNQSSLEEIKKKIIFLCRDLGRERARLKEKEERLEKLIKRKWKLEEEKIQIKIIKPREKKEILITEEERIFTKEEEELLEFLKKEMKCLKKTEKIQEDGLS